MSALLSSVSLVHNVDVCLSFWQIYSSSSKDQRGMHVAVLNQATVRLHNFNTVSNFT